jgi:hypothetical protein
MTEQIRDFAATARKHTKFQICEAHQWINGERRERRAEIFGEGGPGFGGPCSGDKCRMWPGTDLFIPEICHGERELDWRVNR